MTSKKLLINNPEGSGSVKKRISAQKKVLLEMLEKVPVISVACKRSGISRATLYRWKDDDGEFARIVEKKISEGTLAINDLAKSKIIELINQSNLTAAIFWLKSHDAEFIEKRKMSIEHYTKMTEPVSQKTIDAIRQTMGNFGKGLERIKHLKK